MQESKRDIKTLVGLIPDADEPEKTSKFTGPSPEIAAKICDEVLAGGQESLLELIAMLRPPSEQGPRDFKAGYLLHCLAVHVGRTGKEAERTMLAETLASQLGGEKLPKAAQGLLIRELQVAGGKEAVEALGKALLDEELYEYVAQALLAIRDGATPELRKAFPKAGEKGRVTLAQALGVVRDVESLGPLKEAASDKDRAVRMAAAWALANIGDPGGAEVLKSAASAEDGWERIQATKACLLLAERLWSSGKKVEAEAVYTHLRDTRKDPADAYVRDAAERGLGAMGKRG